MITRITRLAVAFGTVAASLALLPASPAHADPTGATTNPTPVVSYTFDNDSGSTVTDGTAAHNNGSWVGTPSYAAGVSGQAAYVSNKTNEVVVPRVAGQTDAASSFSYNFWIKQVSFTSDSWIFTNIGGSSCTTGLGLYNQSGTAGRLMGCEVKGGSKYYQTDWSGTTSITGAWHQIGVSVDRTAQTLTWYLDGTSMVTAALDSTVDLNSGKPFTFGGDADRSYAPYTNSYIDDLNFYNVPLTAAQMKADYDATNPATHFPVTVTNDGHGTGTSSPLAATTGATVTLSSTPATGYHFGSWTAVTPPALLITGNTFTDPGTAVTVKAGFTANTYTVAFDGNSATSGSTASQTMTYDTAATLNANGFVRTGYQFAGWATTPTGAKAYDDQASVKNLAPSGTITLYALWKPANSYFVKVSGDARTTVASSTDGTGYAAAGSTVRLTATSSTGYHSSYVVDAPSGLTVNADGTFTMPAADVTIRAVSAANHYTVVFDGNGATGGSTSSQSIAYDQATPLTANGYTATGKAFTGWATTAAGNPTYADRQSVTNLASADGATVRLYAAFRRVRAAGDTVAPVLSYDFTGNLKDSSGGGNVATWKGNATYAHGFDGLAAHVSGGTNVVQLPRLAGLTDGTGSFSYSAWFGEYGETVDGPFVSNQNFASCTNAGLTHFNISGTTTPGLCWGTTVGGTRVKPTVSSTALKGSWHYQTVVVDRSANTVSYYLDGTKTYTSTSGQVTAATSFNSGLPFFVGQDGTGVYTDGAADALVDDLDFYNVALTDAQVSNDYQATKPATVTLPDESTVDVQGSTGTTVPKGFLATDFHAAQVRVGQPVAQPLAGLWNGAAVTSYRKVSGADWLAVGANGTVTGTAPSAVPQHPATITVEATDGTTTSRVTVEVTVLAAGDAAQLATATWNQWDSGSHVDDADKKVLGTIATNGLEVIGLQEDGDQAAQRIGDALGWYSYEGSHGLGIVSAYPIATTGTTPATDSAPATGVSVDVLGDRVRVWSTALDNQAYGPRAACTGSTPDQLVAAERASTRYAQAQAVASLVKPDVDAGGPVLLLGDLESPAAADWTSSTAASHCGVGAVAWPVPAAVAAAGLTDAYRAAHPDPVAFPGTTWSLFDSTVPQDRVDYVDFAGSRLHLLGANPMVAGFPSTVDPSTNAWTSDHRAVVATFTLGTPLAPTAPPTVTAGHATVAYQAGHGAASDSALLAAIAPAASPSDATVRVDSGAVDYGTPGAYTALVTAVRNGYVSDPVAVTVRIQLDPIVLSNTVLPSLGGTVAPGSTVTADPGVWNRSDLTFTYQWLADGDPISGAIARTYTPTSDQVGRLLSVRVYASLPGSTTVNALSATARITSKQVTNTAAPVISGSGAVGATLQVSTGSWNYDDLGYAYAWFANGSMIRGASKATYVVPSGLAGKTITARVTAGRSGSDSVAAMSSNSITIAN